MNNNKHLQYIETITAAYIFFSTFVVTIILTLADRADLTGIALFGFLLAFGGSFICLVLRLLIAFSLMKRQTRKVKRISGYILLTLLSILTIFLLIVTLYLAMSRHMELYYTRYQLSMNVIMIAQWFTTKYLLR